jgi:type I restriction enzyme M protein
MLDQTTKRKLDSARQILVGKVPDPKAQVEQITDALGVSPDDLMK